MSFLKAFNFSAPYSINAELPELYPFSLEYSEFVNSDIKSIYTKILTDVVDRTQGISEELEMNLWDNCLANEASKGLVTLLSEAMTYKKDLYLVFQNDVLRKATQQELTTIRDDYQSKGFSDIGVYISFGSYKRTDMLRVYSEMEYSVLNSLNKKLNISSAMMFKMSGLRESVANSNKEPIETQAKTMTSALALGRNVLMDQNDSIEMAVPDMATTKEAIEFLDSKRAFYLNLPNSYITGSLTSGIGSTGESDTKAIERGLRGYYVSIIKPVVEALFGISLSYKSQDFRMIQTAFEAIKTFELVGNDYISDENKKLIVDRLLDIDDVY
jgi:hypothetical protein